MRYVAPILIGSVYVLSMSLVPEPRRRRFNALAAPMSFRERAGQYFVRVARR